MKYDEIRHPALESEIRRKGTKCDSEVWSGNLRRTIHLVSVHRLYSEGLAIRPLQINSLFPVHRPHPVTASSK